MVAHSIGLDRYWNEIYSLERFLEFLNNWWKGLISIPLAWTNFCKAFSILWSWHICLQTFRCVGYEHFIFSSLEACKKKNNPNLFSCVVFQSIKCFVVIDQLREAVLIDGWNWNTPLEVFVRWMKCITSCGVQTSLPLIIWMTYLINTLLQMLFIVLD